MDPEAACLQQLSVIRPYLARSRGELVGYLVFLSDAVSLKTPDRKKLLLADDDHPTVPAAKVARLAVATIFRERDTGLGTLRMRFAFDVALDHAAEVGCRLLMVDAHPTAIGFHEKLGFVCSERTRDADEGADASDTASLRLELLSTPARVKE